MILPHFVSEMLLNLRIKAVAKLSENYTHYDNHFRDWVESHANIETDHTFIRVPMFNKNDTTLLSVPN